MAKCTPTQAVYEKLHCIGITPNDIPTRFKPSTLPFTGLNIGLILVSALILIIVGLSLRAITRKTN